MQLTIDIDNHLLESLQKEFHTTNLKEAISQLLDAYKQSKAIEIIEKRDSDYHLIEEARQRRNDGEKTYSLDSVISEFE